MRCRRHEAHQGSGSAASWGTKGQSTRPGKPQNPLPAGLPSCLGLHMLQLPCFTVPACTSAVLVVRNPAMLARFSMPPSPEGYFDVNKKRPVPLQGTQKLKQGTQKLQLGRNPFSGGGAGKGSGTKGVGTSFLRSARKDPNTVSIPN